MEIKLQHEDIQIMNLFENMAHTKVVDYLRDDATMYFVVDCQNIREIIGPGGERIKRIGQKFGANVKVFKYSPEIKEFAENLFQVPLKSFGISEKNGEKTLRISVENSDKSIVIGRGGKNIKILKELLKRSFSVADVRLF